MMTITDQDARIVRLAMQRAKKLSDHTLAKRGEMADALCEHKAKPISEGLARALDIVEAGILASVMEDAAKPPTRGEALPSAQVRL